MNYRKSKNLSGWDFSSLNVSEKGPRTNYMNIVRKYSGLNKTLLDIGTGGGEIVLKLAQNFKECMAFDKNLKKIQTAKKNLKNSGFDNVKFFVADSDKINIENRSFDVIICRHAPFNPEEVLRLLKSGEIFITQQVSEGDKKNFKKLFGRGQCFDIPSGTLKKKYLKDLKSLGFRIIKQRTVNTTEYYKTMDDIIFLLSNSPIIPDFDLEKDENKLKELEKKFKTKDGIRTNSERFIIIASK